MGEAPVSFQSARIHFWSLPMLVSARHKRKISEWSHKEVRNEGKTKKKRHSFTADHHHLQRCKEISRRGNCEFGGCGNEMRRRTSGAFTSDYPEKRIEEATHVYIKRGKMLRQKKDDFLSDCFVKSLFF